MNRSKQIDEFLNYWAAIYSQNLNYPISKETLYGALMEYGLTIQERQNPSIESLFPAWESYFQNNPDLHVYRDNRQYCFLQFMSRGDKGTQHVKLYLSYPPDKIEYCVKKIFAFVAANHMTNGSKVADRVRSDSVVLRMTNYDDALKVMNFINRDPELVMYAKPTNPFMMKNGKVGVSYDDNLSFNSTLAFMLEQYFIQCRKTNSLERVNSNHFREYINNFLNTVFKDGKSLQQFKNYQEIARMVPRFNSVGDALVNYEQVLKLMMMQLDDRMDMDKFRSFYVDAKNSSKNQQMADYYNQLVNNAYRTDRKLEKTASMEEIAIINGYINFAIQKYGNRESVIAYLQKYIEEENIKAITRDGGMREKFIAGMTPKRAKFIMADDISAYVTQILNPVKEEQQETEVAPSISFEEQLLQDYITLARVKYGDGGAVAYLNDYCSGNQNAITKEGNFRARFIQYLPPKRVLQITNNNIKEYVFSYVRSKYSESLIDDVMYDNFVNACMETYKKFGDRQLKGAIRYGMAANYQYFTNAGKCLRENMEILTPEMYKQCCRQLLRNYGNNLSEIENLLQKCSEIIIQLVSDSEKQNQTKITM